MTEIKNTFSKILELMRISDYSVDLSADGKRINIFIPHDSFITNQLPNLVNDFNHLGQLIAKKHNNIDFSCVDINNYRLERERIITDIAKAAARKALMTKNDISLPTMNSYERRLIHMELSMRPDVRTESEGLGKNRYVKIKPILD